MKILKKINPIFLILILAFCLRLINMSKIPLFGDEIDVANHTYFLSKTLRDYRGNFLPFYIDSFSESRAPLLMYTSIPFFIFLGKSALTLRLTPLIFGILSIYFFYLLINLITKKRKMALISALIMSIIPWHIHYSQMSFEVTLLLFLILAGTYFYLKNKYFLSVVLFSLCFYTYSVANIFIPIYAIFLYFYHKPIPLKKIIKLSLLVIFLLSPIILNIFEGKASNRFKLISIFNNPQKITKLIYRRTSFSSNPKIERIFNNKATLFSSEFLKNYTEALSFSFLFTEKGDPSPRHQIPGKPLLFTILIIPFIIGLFSKPDKLFIFFLLIAPISSALTQEGGRHATRLFIMIPPLCYLISLGLFKLSKNIKYVIFGLCAISLFFYFHEYEYYWQENYQNLNGNYNELFSHIPKNCSRYFISNTTYNSLPYFLFYKNYEPSNFLKEFKGDKNKENIFLDMSGFSLGKNIFFINDWQGDGDNFSKIQKFAQTNDCFLFFEGTDINGKIKLSEEYQTIHATISPSKNLFGQIIKKTK
jgi:4-amino-4-deoxy-L-arabinose transferase-like glycosyltransferase